jgi:exonuclease SbcC
MIINSLWAENVLKYSTLKLDDIPTQGLIAVIGDNESGKSSIGESVCFALFGRTFSLEPKDLDKVIRWGESRCSIKLDLTTPNGQRYQIARFLDELGNRGASISRIGEEPMVRGVEEVQARLKDIIGFGYTEFIESFYLAQREITTPHPHSYAVKAMAGVDALEKVVVSCKNELEQAGEQTIDTEKQRGEIEEQIEAIDLQEGYLESLEVEYRTESDVLAEDREKIAALKDSAEKSDRAVGTLKEGSAGWLAVPMTASFEQRQQQGGQLDLLVSDLETHCAENKQTVGACAKLRDLARESRERIAAFEALRQRADAYRSWLQRLLDDTEPAEADSAEPTFAARQEGLQEREAKASSARKTSRILMLAFLFSALAVWAVTALLGLAPDSPQAQTLTGWLAGIDADFTHRLQPWLPIVASILTLLFLGFMGRVIGLSSQIKGLSRSHEMLSNEEEAARREATELAGLDDMPLPEAATVLGKLRDDAIAGRVPNFRKGPGAPLLDHERHAAGQEDFRRIVQELETAISQVKTDAGQEIERRHESVAKHSSAIARLDEVIAQERERVRRHNELVGIAQSLQDKLDGLRRQARVRTLAIDLLHGAIHYISQRFNTEVRNLSADSLPTFTNGRYEHLQIDENLKVKAFSNEKRDFMDLDEISSGTQRQIMLAVRLSLSQKLVNSVIQGPQMLFLDEPFAFFDERRTASSLTVLPQVSGDFTQIWVTSQTFPAESHFDLYVECNAEETRSPSVRRGSSSD